MSCFRPSYEGRDLEIEDIENKCSEYVSLYKRDYYIHGDSNNNENEEVVDKDQRSVKDVGQKRKLRQQEVSGGQVGINCFID